VSETIGDAEARIERGELTRRRRLGFERGSVVMLADPGFGKTTALEQALAERTGATVWLRASAIDRDSGRLVARLAERLRAQLPGIAEGHGERLAARRRWRSSTRCCQRKAS
jgi:ATP/maltotriose-dependent transcriptional regulator MalT